AGAAALFEKAVTAREEVLKSVPTSPARQRNVIVARAELGDHLLKTGDATGAREQYERLVAVSRDFRLGDDSPVGVTNLALAYYRLGTAELECGDRPASQKSYGECLKMREQVAARNPNNISAQTGYMLALARCGDHARAAEIAEKVRAMQPKSPGNLVQVGCC